MEKRIFGIVLTVLGIVGLVMAAVQFANANSHVTNWRALTIYGVLGAIFFFTGISLIRSTRDVIDRDERIS